VLYVLGMAGTVADTWFSRDPLVFSPGGVDSSIGFIMSNVGGGKSQELPLPNTC
jgi:hypothetical protein